MLFDYSFYYNVPFFDVSLVCGKSSFLLTTLSRYNLYTIKVTHSMRSLMFSVYLKSQAGASLVAQWLRICLPMQGTRVRALVWEDPTCRGAAGPVSHNY